MVTFRRVKIDGLNSINSIIDGFTFMKNKVPINGNLVSKLIFYAISPCDQAMEVLELASLTATATGTKENTRNDYQKT